MERTLGKNKQISKDDRKSSKIQIPIIGILKQFFQVIGFELGPAAFIKQLQTEQGVPRENLVFNAVNKFFFVFAHIVRHAIANDVSV